MSYVSSPYIPAHLRHFGEASSNADRIDEMFLFASRSVVRRVNSGGECGAPPGGRGRGRKPLW